MEHDQDRRRTVFQTVGGQEGIRAVLRKIRVCGRIGNPCYEKLSPRKVIHEDEGYLQAEIPAQGACSVEASCLYGVFSRGDAPFLLNYYAKHVRAESSAELSRLARASELPLDIVPTWDQRGLQLQILWQDKPVASAELHSVDPHANENTSTSDQDGYVSLRVDGPGLYGVRANYIEKGRSGEHEGKAYGEVRHYCTLTLQLPLVESVGSAAPIAAADLLARVRAARALWEEFPGFAADVSVLDVARNAEGKYLPQTFTVSYWDAETGAVRFHQTHQQQYARVGRFDLPARLMEVYSAPNEYHVRTIALCNHRLLDPKGSQEERK